MVTCHALHCPNQALPGQPQCYDHWMMLPAKVRESRRWVRPVDRLHISHEKAVDESRNLHRTGPNVHTGGQMELFA